MGGIFGLVCRKPCSPGAVVEGLRRLTYRGYDGTGVAYLDESGGIVVKKAAKHVDEADKELGLSRVSSVLVLGHVRYASRGWPSHENTHPLLDCSGSIAVVGDGVIENYEDARRDLERRGHRFASRTDTEVYAHLLEDLVKQGRSPLEAMAEAARGLRGAYAVAAVFRGVRRLYAVNMGQPIVVGIRGDGECVYISSDIPSLYGYADEALIVEEGMAVEAGVDGVRVVDVPTLRGVSELRRKRVKYPVEVIDKAGYPHYMLKEIYEIPDAIIRTTYSLMEKYLRLASMIVYGARNVYIIANGTSLHAGLVASYYFAELAGINVSVVSAAEFPYYALENVSTGTVVIAISQSGETSDVIKSIKLAKQHGAVVVGVTNVVGSRLTLESNVYLPIGAGPEIAVPATKTFVSTLVAMAVLASYTGLYTGSIDRSGVNGVIEGLRGFAKKLSERIPGLDRSVQPIARDLAGATSLYVVSSGINYPVALEAALKLKEAAMMHAEGVQLGELRHGPMVLVGRSYPVVFIKPVEEPAIELYNRVASEALNKGAYLVTITHDGTGYGRLVTTAEATRVLAPIASVIPAQLLAYHIGRIKGLPIDTPPGLAKAITT